VVLSQAYDRWAWRWLSGQGPALLFPGRGRGGARWTPLGGGARYWPRPTTGEHI
jgi:hypothetical protein